MQRYLAVFYSFIFLILAMTSVHASRLALIIGNGDYQNVSSLETPVNDAKDMAVVLKKLGFKVILNSDVNHRQMVEAVQQFGERLRRNGGVGLFYFSGYGLQNNGHNFLVPIDANIKSEADIEFESLDVHRVLAQMEQANNGVNIVILEACRDNPYKKNLKDYQDGLATMESPKRNLVAYATYPDTISIEPNSERNSLYTKHLLVALRENPYLSITDIFIQVRQQVMLETNKKQVPWESVSLRDAFSFAQFPKSLVTIENPQPHTPPPANQTFTPDKVFRDRLQDGSLGPEMVRIPAGRFRMGDIQGGGDNDELPTHWVSIKRFAMARYEVTFEEYDRFTVATGREKPDDEGWGRGKRPVINISWENARAYAKWLTQQTGHTYRLPTEAEWEYVARAGTETSRYWGNEPDHACLYANVRDATFEKELNLGTIHNCEDGYIVTAPVGRFQPNAFGVFDMLGNVREWTCSEYEEKYTGKEQSCKIDKNNAKENAISRVIRGGSWLNTSWSVRAAYRDWYQQDYRLNFVGFRLVKI